jgi:hypothetical protein
MPAVSRGLAMPTLRIVSLLGLLSLPACAVSTAGGERLTLTSPEFRAYVERVFRDQNRIADELAFALESPAGEQDALAAAEQGLLAACAGVNELATARRDAQRLGPRRSAQAARTVPRCEAATQAAATTLAASRQGP